MPGSAGISIRRQGKAGRITLTRPHALNALTYEMVMAIEAALIEWRGDEDVALVLVDAEGEKAFCAGGDLGQIYRAGRLGDFAYSRKFWSDEYRLNAMIAGYSKPVVSLMHGYIMGGGVGIGCHGSTRIVCETSRVAMPECAIGLIPDVGGSWLLARAPGHAGEYLALTGARMSGADALYCGFADRFVPRERWGQLAEQLRAAGDVGAVAELARHPGDSEIERQQSEIDLLFGAGSALECLKACERWESALASEAVAAIRRGCPLSVACAFELVRRNRVAASLREALDNELRFTWRSMSEGELLEGVRAQIVDKDRTPNWRIARLEDVTPAQVDAMLAPIGRAQAA